MYGTVLYKIENNFLYFCTYISFLSDFPFPDLTLNYLPYFKAKNVHDIATIMRYLPYMQIRVSLRFSSKTWLDNHWTSQKGRVLGPDRDPAFKMKMDPDADPDPRSGSRALFLACIFIWLFCVLFKFFNNSNVVQNFGCLYFMKIGKRKLSGVVQLLYFNIGKF